MSAAQEAVSFTNEDGSSLDNDSILFEAKAGFESVRKIRAKNIHPVYPIQLANPRPVHPTISILKYPTQVLKPGESDIIEVQYNAPADEISMIKGFAEFDLNVIAVG